MRNVCVRCICKQTTRLHYKYITVLINVLNVLYILHLKLHIYLLTITFIFYQKISMSFRNE